MPTLSITTVKGNIAFENEEARQRIYEETYNDWWISEIRPKVFTLIDETSISVKLLHSVD